MGSMVHRRTVLVKVWERRFTRTGGKGHKVRKQDGSRTVLVKVREQRFTRTGGKGHKVRKQDGSSEGRSRNVH